jgi:phage FluMu protein gp41
MALTKQTTYDAVTILSNGNVEIRMKTTAFDDDGSELGYRYFRRVIAAMDDITGEPLKLRQICNIARS